MAMKRTNTFYPHVLEQNPHTHFRLRCRKFVEMIRQSTELSEISAEKRSRPLNGHSAVQDDDFEPDMDMDETMNNGDDWDQMETEEGDHELKHQPLLDDTVRYGQELKYDYKDDHSKYVQDALKEIFSMFAYEDIRKSPTSHLIDPSGRVPVAEELNSAILGMYLFFLFLFLFCQANFAMQSWYSILAQSRLVNPPPPRSNVSINRPRFLSTILATKEAQGRSSMSGMIFFGEPADGL